MWGLGPTKLNNKYEILPKFCIILLFEIANLEPDGRGAWPEDETVNHMIFSIKPLRSPELPDVNFPTAIDTALLNVASAELLLFELRELKQLTLPIPDHLVRASDSALNMVIFAGEVLGHYLAAGRPIAALHCSVRISQAKISCFNEVLKRIRDLEQSWNVMAAWEYGLRTGEGKYNEMWGTARTEGAPWKWE